MDGLRVFSDEEVPLNLSTKPSDISSSISRKSEIWSPGSVCEREARETRAPSSTGSPSSTPIITRQIHHSPLTPPSSTERTFQVSVNISYLFTLIHLIPFRPASAAVVDSEGTDDALFRRGEKDILLWDSNGISKASGRKVRNNISKTILHACYLSVRTPRQGRGKIQLSFFESREPARKKASVAP